MHRTVRLVCLALLLLYLAAGAAEGSGTVLVEYSCETPIEGVQVAAGAPDGSHYYITEAAVDLPGLPEDSMELLVWSMDIRFDEEGAGFTPVATDGRLGTCIRSHTRREQYHLAVQAGNTVFSPMVEVERGQWYHLELMGKYSAPDSFMYLLLWRYSEQGERTDLQIFTNVNRRQLNANVGQGASLIRLEPHTSVDNIKVFKPAADSLTLSANSDLVVAGQQLQLTVEGFRYGIPLTLQESVSYRIYDPSGALLDSPEITVDSSGVLQAAAFVPDQEVIVEAVDIGGAVSNPVRVAIKSNSILQIVSAGFNREQTQLVDLEVVKNSACDCPAVLVIEVYNPEGSLYERAYRPVDSGSIPIKEPVFLPVGYALPEQFDEQWQLAVRFVSSLD
ncbi:MAG: hypothetical protein GX228_04810 [Firmicutes bacterium]|nr:hypothetical protein [Bacillota bacterium]NLL88242.1 hypothetical protein [Bacillota bacterium]